MTQLVHRSEAWSMRPALLLKSSEAQRSNATSVIQGINARTSAAQTLQTHTGAVQVAFMPVGRANCQVGCWGTAFIAGLCAQPAIATCANIITAA